MMTTAKTKPIVKAPGAFVLIGRDRILRTAIKRYLPDSNKSINIYFNTSLSKPEIKTFIFANTGQQINMLMYLDSIYL